MFYSQATRVQGSGASRNEEEEEEELCGLNGRLRKMYSLYYSLSLHKSRKRQLRAKSDMVSWPLQIYCIMIMSSCRIKGVRGVGRFGACHTVLPT